METSAYTYDYRLKNILPVDRLDIDVGIDVRREISNKFSKPIIFETVLFFHK